MRGVGVVTATCPLVGKECLALEIAVELVFSLDFEIAHSVADEAFHELAEFGGRILFHAYEFSARRGALSIV